MRPKLLAAYQVLQVAPWATLDDLNRAYRARVKRCHPDGGIQDPEPLARLNVAREVAAADPRRPRRSLPQLGPAAPHMAPADG